jgi:hypothetical protein
MPDWPDDSYIEWLKRNPPPWLPGLVRYGSLADIPPEVWAEFEQQVAAWQERCRARRKAQ